MASAEPDALFEEHRPTCHECGVVFDPGHVSRLTAAVVDHYVREHGLDA